MKLKIKECDIRHAEQGRRYRSTSRVYIWIDNDKRDKPVVELVTGFRYNKPHQVYKEQVIPQVLKRMKCPADTKVRWSQYAGCSCPCSPGFIVNQVGEPKDVFVTVFNTQPELFETEA